MKTRKLGANGPELSAIGLGCMRMTPLTAQQGRAGKDEGIATIHAALDTGITLLNTGDFYTMGANEMLVGEALRAIADRKGATPAQIAIAWVLAQGEDLIPLVGMSNRSRLPENLGALDVALSPEDLAALDRAFAPGAIAGSRYPEGLESHVAS